MTPTTAAVRAGLSRRLIELRHSFTGTALVSQLFWPVATLAAIAWQVARDPVPGRRT
ncbi:hypothetical protein [Specibacter cremeus]|uniref:hypothetical protein n=1 Tax=Specibacter cremeus TaxID=1629051 RepID=UPI001F0CA866|nr:hypothetical protein [Specibacter cremeus]